MLDTWSCAWREVVRRKGRTLASVLGYLLAVALVILLVTLTRSAKEAANEVLAHTGTHFVAFPPASNVPCPDCSARETGDLREGFVLAGVRTHVMPKRLIDRVAAIPSVGEAAPYLMFRFRDPEDGHAFTVGGFDLRNKNVVGTTCCAATDIVEGRFLASDEKGGVVLEEAYARLRGLAVGDIVRIVRIPYRVVGVVNPGIRPAKADIYALIGDVEWLINGVIADEPLRDEVNAILIEVADSRKQEEAIVAVKKALPGFITSSYACYKPAARVMGINESAVWLLVVVSCVGAVAFALKSQSASVVERQRDIGVLKAIGWTNWNVSSQILAESLLQALTGGVLGCILASVVLLVLPAAGLGPEPGGTPVSAFSPLLALAGLALALAGGLVAGLLPAWRAASRSPADALRRI